MTPTRLSVQLLEDRATPATLIAYTPATQTLTLTATPETVPTAPYFRVTAVPDSPVGFIHVADSLSNTVFDSGVGNKAVRNLVVRFGNVEDGTLTLTADVHLGG